MLRREWDRLPKAKLEAGICLLFGGSALRLIGNQHHWLARTPDQSGDVSVGRQNAGTGIDEDQNGVSGFDRRTRLSAHAAREGVVIGVLEAGRIDRCEGEVAQCGLAFAAVACDAGPVVHKRKLASDETIEERR